MERVCLKKVVKNLDNFRYKLVIYYHKDLSIKDIYNRVIKKEERLKHYEVETRDWNESLLVTDDEGVSYLIINSHIPVSIIMHETIHIITAIFTFIGSEHTEETDELYAYNAQHIFEFILSTMINKFKVPASKLMRL